MKTRVGVLKLGVWGCFEVKKGHAAPQISCMQQIPCSMQLNIPSHNIYLYVLQAPLLFLIRGVRSLCAAAMHPHLLLRQRAWNSKHAKTLQRRFALSGYG